MRLTALALLVLLPGCWCGRTKAPAPAPEAAEQADECYDENGDFIDTCPE